MRYQLHQLELVYPPISNQEAEWIKDDPAAQEQISKSNLYFIGQKPETFFEFPSEEDVQRILINERKLRFDIICGGKRSPCILDINLMCDFYTVPREVEIELEIGKKVITIWRMDGEEPQVFEWFFTEKLIFDKSRKKPFILEFDDFSEFFTYHLHYVGISKSQTSFERLIVKAHDKRLRILTNEHPLTNGSRVTDEIILFSSK